MMNPGSTATKQMSDKFAAADATVNDQMDALMPQFAAAKAEVVADILASIKERWA